MSSYTFTIQTRQLEDGRWTVDDCLPMRGSVDPIIAHNERDAIGAALIRAAWNAVFPTAPLPAPPTAGEKETT